MHPEIVVAVLSGLGTLPHRPAGKESGPAQSAWGAVSVIEEKVKVINHRIDDLERMEETHEKLP